MDHVQHLQTVGKVGLHVQFVRHEYSFGSLGTEAAPRKRGGRVPAETRLFEFRTKQLRDEVLEHAKRAVSNSKSDNYVPSREEMRQLRDKWREQVRGKLVVLSAARAACCLRFRLVVLSAARAGCCPR